MTQQFWLSAKPSLAVMSTTSTRIQQNIVILDMGSVVQHCNYLAAPVFGCRAQEAAWPQRRRL
jgi:hypothetical protein